MDIDDLFDVKGDDSVVLRVHVQPGAGRSQVVGRHGSALKLRIAAPPVGGRANEASAELVATTFSLASAQVELVGGQTGRAKVFRLNGVDLETFRRELERVVGEARPGSNPRSPTRS